MTGFVELDALTNFTFLEGASHPEEMVLQAKAIGLAAIGVADRNSLAGVVRAYRASKKHEFPILVGCRLTFRDGAELIVYPRDRAAYGRLCRLLSLGKSRIAEPQDDLPPLPAWGERSGEEGTAQPARPLQGSLHGDLLEDASAGAAPDPASPPLGGEERIAKNETHLDFEDAVALGEGLIGIARAPDILDDAFLTRLQHWRSAWPDDLYLAANLLRRGDDRTRLAQLARIGQAADAPLVATNAALYHHHERRMLQDVLTCIREKTAIDQAGHRLAANAERHLKPLKEMLRLFAGYEDAVSRSVVIAEACRFRLDELQYQYPNEPVPPGKEANQHLRDLVLAGAEEIFKGAVPDKVAETIDKELELIRDLDYPHYFLTVHDIVAYAKSVGILCQGRGSAANSVVCFCLGITKVNPAEQSLLFERFLSKERREPPDIDVDFEHERREEVMQYVYRRYGRHRAAIVATVIHYRPRSAIRDVGKALGLTEDLTSQLASTVWGSYGRKIEDEHVDATGLDRSDRRLTLALDLAAELVQFPRHLSQHVGGFVLTEGPLVEMVPVANAAMKDRTFIEWDKDDIDELKIMKVDVLALGMLTAIRKAFDLIETYDERPMLHMPPTDQGVYDMACRGDTIGVFQIESRAQMAMLPRLQPRCFYDLAVQVAIVRPGPIQGGMVHPYLRQREARRREGKAFRIDYPSPAPPHPAEELKPVLDRTLGVPIFQEQAMQIAMVAAEFSGDEANGLRRAMATFRHLGEMHLYEEMMVGRMIKRGYDPEFAQSCFNQIRGFGEYGFPESHAASFAHLVYVSAWIKHRHPAAFAAALLNSQPMGFYAPAQIIRCARDHGVKVLHPDVNISVWDNVLEAEGKALALRLGLRQIGGFKESWAIAIEANRPFANLDDLRLRAKLPARALELLAGADALSSLDLSRRGGLWAARGLPRAAPAPLFAAAGIDEADGAPPTALPAMSEPEEVVGDYETLRLSLKAHPVSFLRGRLAAERIIPCAGVETARLGARVAACGVVLVRQRPGSAKGVCFITLEDETGIANLVVWPKVFETYRPLIMSAKLLLARGRIQRASDAEGGVTHLVVEHLEDRTGDLMTLSAEPVRTARAPGDEPGRAGASPAERHRHPRDVRLLPKSRDFH